MVDGVQSNTACLGTWVVSICQRVVSSNRILYLEPARKRGGCPPRVARVLRTRSEDISQQHLSTSDYFAYCVDVWPTATRGSKNKTLSDSLTWLRTQER